MPRPKLKIRLSRALCDNENLVGLMGSTNRVTSSVSVRLPTFLLHIFRYFIQFLCSDGIGWREWKLIVWGGGGCASEARWGKVMAKSKLERWFAEVSWRVLFMELRGKYCVSSHSISISGTFLQTWEMYKDGLQGEFYSLSFLWGRIYCWSV